MKTWIEIKNLLKSLGFNDLEIKSYGKFQCMVYEGHHNNICVEVCTFDEYEMIDANVLIEDDATPEWIIEFDRICQNKNREILA